jgi:glycogen synthase
MAGQLRRGGARLRLRSAHRGEFRELVPTCMRADYSWARPGQEYLDIYEYIRHK